MHFVFIWLGALHSSFTVYCHNHKKTFSVDFRMPVSLVCMYVIFHDQQHGNHVKKLLIKQLRLISYLTARYSVLILDFFPLQEISTVKLCFVQKEKKRKERVVCVPIACLKARVCTKKPWNVK